MDESDDFGDLYADLDDHVNAGVAINGSEAKLEEFDSTSEDHCSNGRTLECNGAAVDLGDGIMDSEDCSDSEDDFHIVLNKDQCSKMASFGNARGAMGEGDDGERDEDEDFLIASGSDHVNKDQRSDQLLSLDWHAGPHSRGLLSNSRTSLSAQGDWDQLVVPISSSNSSVSTTAQKGFTFFLPRNRTIFDINIEAFGLKPWRQHGVDITNYFNFGLDEDSWKNYCEDLDCLRQQATVLNQFLHNEPSRLNQFVKSVPCEATQYGLGKRTPLIMENIDNGFKGLAKPKGRAIQVESGIGERMPSIDMKRPRQWDSDVVIHINMEASEDNLSTQNELELGHAEQDSFGSVIQYENKSSEKFSFQDRGDKECQKDADLVEHHYALKETIVKCTHKDALAKHDQQIDSSRANGSIAKALSASADSHSCELDIPSEASIDGSHFKRAHRPIKVTSLNGVVGFQESVQSYHYTSNSSRGKVNKAEEESRRSGNYSHALSRGDHRGCSGTRCQSWAESHTAAKDEQAFIQSFNKCNLDCLNISNKIMQKQFNHGYDVRRSVSSAKGTKLSVMMSQRNAGKHRSKQSTVRSSQSNANHSMFPENNLEQRDCLLEQGFGSRNGKEHKDRFLHENVDKKRWQPLSCENSLCQRQRKESRHHLLLEAKPVDDVNEYGSMEPYAQEMPRRHVSHNSWEDQLFCDTTYETKELRSPEMRGKNEHWSSAYVRNNEENLRRLDRSLLDSSRYANLIPNERCCHDDDSLIRQSNKWRRPNVRKVQSESKNHRYRFVQSSTSCRHSVFEDGFEWHTDEGILDERDGYHDKVIEMRGYSDLAKRRLHIDNVLSKHQDQVELSSLKRSLCGRRHETDYQHVFNGGKLYDTHQPDNARNDVTKEAKSGFDDRRYFMSVSDSFDERRHEFAMLEGKRAVNMRLNGWNDGKLAGKGHEVSCGSERDSHSCFAIEKEQDHSACNGLISKMSRPEGRRTYPTNLKAEKLKQSELCLFKEKFCERNPILQVHEDDEIEEGQLIEESEYQAVDCKKKDRNRSKYMTSGVEAIPLVHCEEKNTLPKDSNSKNDRILEMLAKMERRKERFKESITPSKVAEGSDMAPVDIPATSADEIKKQRPLRKRRWGAN
ncbi:FIP1[V]-like protein isoform X1 [Ananas comosus]|uniref:FIP1[V]-like protein isoform X1 n=1 Tax=Ananas comosus TaxID=4615 RepID=A0A6P5GQ31_ANACO|nr:FIP1[V]-like protein isoform X1 [Ananas comosus]